MSFLVPSLLSRVSNDFLGKTVLLVYLLVYFLQHGQVVLYSPHATLSILFYHDGVYMAAPGYAHNFLPKPKPGSRAFIWSLFEAEVGESMAFAHRSGVLFPIQAPSPNPKYYSWRNYRRPPITALPLWDREELKQGYVSSIPSWSILTILSPGSRCKLAMLT